MRANPRVRAKVAVARVQICPWKKCLQRISRGGSYDDARDARVRRKSSGRFEIRARQEIDGMVLSQEERGSVRLLAGGLLVSERLEGSLWMARGHRRLRLLITALPKPPPIGASRQSLETTPAQMKSGG